MEQLLDFSKEKQLKIKVTKDGKEEIISLRYPKVKDQKLLAKKTKGLKEDDPAMADLAFEWLETLGLPKDICDELEQPQVMQIIDKLTGKSEKK